MSRIGVVGATSPLGVHLVEHLLDQGFEVVTGYRRAHRIPFGWQGRAGLECRRVELEEPESAGQAFAGCEALVWLAHRPAGNGGSDEVGLNADPFRAALLGLPELHGRRIVLVSSGGSVYGQALALPMDEDHVRQPISAYGMAKRRMENILLSRDDRPGVLTAILRVGNIYGFRPELDSKGVVTAYLASWSAAAPFALIGDGEAVRDFVHVGDVVLAIHQAVTTDLRHVVWNVGSGQGQRIRDVLRMLDESGGESGPHPVTHMPWRATDVRENVLAIGRIAREAGWRPRVEFSQGLARTIAEWTRAGRLRAEGARSVAAAAVIGRASPC